MLVAGGVSFFGTVFPTSAELYDPASGNWSPTLPLVSGRTEHFAAVLPDGKVLLAGGLNTSDTGPTTELFDLAQVVATPFVLSPPTQLKPNVIQFEFRNTPGLGFSVLSVTNVAVLVEEWPSLGLATEISPGHYQFTDSSADSPQRFYRVRSP